MIFSVISVFFLILTFQEARRREIIMPWQMKLFMVVATIVAFAKNVSECREEYKINQIEKANYEAAVEKYGEDVLLQGVDIIVRDSETGELIEVRDFVPAEEIKE